MDLNLSSQQLGEECRTLTSSLLEKNPVPRGGSTEPVLLSSPVLDALAALGWGRECVSLSVYCISVITAGIFFGENASSSSVFQQDHLQSW